jgi:hypothetical protein
MSLLTVDFDKLRRDAATRLADPVCPVALTGAAHFLSDQRRARRRNAVRRLGIGLGLFALAAGSWAALAAEPVEHLPLIEPHPAGYSMRLCYYRAPRFVYGIEQTGGSCPRTAPVPADWLDDSANIPAHVIVADGAWRTS